MIARLQLAKCEQGSPPCHAQTANLIALGFEVVGADPDQRGVWFKGELYVEGNLQALVVEASETLREAQKMGRSNGTKGPRKAN